MLITAASLDALRVGFKTEFQRGLGMVESMRARVSMPVPSTTSENRYGWLKSLSGMREWIGPRQVDNFSELAYSIANQHFEKTVGVDRNHIEDDNLGQYNTMFAAMGETSEAQPELMVWDMLRRGFTTNCFDGQYFFDTDHPIVGADGSEATYANTDGGSGTAWYLLCTKRVVRPIIFQERKKAEFVAMDRIDDHAVFHNRKYHYGTDSRNAAGFGFPQLAWGSRQPLTPASYEAARAALIGMKGDGGRPLGILPDLLVVPSSLEGAARRIVKSELGAGGMTNEWAGTAEVLMVPWLG